MANLDNFEILMRRTGEQSNNAFVAHLLDAHGIEVTTDKDWQRRLGSRP